LEKLGKGSGGSPTRPQSAGAVPRWVSPPRESIEAWKNFAGHVPRQRQKGSLLGTRLNKCYSTIKGFGNRTRLVCCLWFLLFAAPLCTMLRHHSAPYLLHHSCGTLVAIHDGLVLCNLMLSFMHIMRHWLDPCWVSARNCFVWHGQARTFCKAYAFRSIKVVDHCGNGEVRFQELMCEMRKRPAFCEALAYLFIGKALICSCTTDPFPRLYTLTAWPKYMSGFHAYQWHADMLLQQCKCLSNASYTQVHVSRHV